MLKYFHLVTTGGYLRLYAEYTRKDNLLFHYDVGEVAITAVNIANDKDAYSQGCISPKETD